MSATTGGETRSGIGARLKAGRERTGLTLLQVAEKLHVDSKLLEALEAERFEQLGAPVYVRGHLKRYAELVGEDTAQLLDEYATVTKPALPDLTQLPKASRQADPRKLVLPSLLVLIAFALVGTVWWVLQNFGGTATFGRPAAPQAVPARLEAEGTARKADNAAAGTGSPSTAASTAAQVAGSSMTGARAVNGAGNGAGAANGANGQAAQISSAATPAEPPRPRSIDLTLKFSADSWVEVYDANGQRLFYDIGSADSSRTLTGTPPLRVVLGNAPGVSLNINGKAATVPPGAVRNDVAQFTIDRSGRIVRGRPEAAASPESRPDGG